MSELSRALKEYDFSEHADRQAERPMTWSSQVSPLTIRIMLACFYSSCPSAEFTDKQWDSTAGIDARAWLQTNGLITRIEQRSGKFAEYKATEKGKAWVAFICATPLPVEKWVLPPREPEHG